MQARGSAVKSITVTAMPLQDESGQMMASPSRSVLMEPLESINNIALDTFAQHQTLIYLRAMIRSITKAVSTAVWGGLADNTSDMGLGLLFSVAQLASTVATEATERADVRCTRFFPALAWVAGVWLDPGNYRVVIEYKNSSGKVVSQEEQTVSLRSNGLNLVESLCLR